MFSIRRLHEEVALPANRRRENEVHSQELSSSSRGGPREAMGEQRALGPLEPPQLLSLLGSRIYLGCAP